MTCPESVGLIGYGGQLEPSDVAPFVGRYVTIAWDMDEEEYQGLLSELRDAEHTGRVPPPIGYMSGVLVRVTKPGPGLLPELVVDYGYSIALSRVASVELDKPENETVDLYYAGVIARLEEGQDFLRQHIARLYTANAHLRRLLREQGEKGDR